MNPLLCLLALLWAMPDARAAAQRPPNFVVVFADDLGYADLGCFGAAAGATPNLDRMAAEGMRFTSFYAAQAVCSASRAALLTGCYPNRVGIQGALGPKSKIGLNPGELTIAELLRERGYAASIFGKWHLGDAPEFLPTRHGFGEWFGLPYSNDMWPWHPEYVGLPSDSPKRGKGYPPLPLFDGERVVNPNVTAADQRELTRQYTARAVKFIEHHRDQPFFLYLPHSMPHVPLHVSKRFAGKSGRGLYGDVMLEIDWSVGEILRTLKRLGLDEQTLVLFTSDNGPWLLYGDHAGRTGSLREGKATTFEGGVRVPFVARWPGRIPKGTVCEQIAGTIDILPTLAALAGAHLPTDRILDGRDVWPLMAGRPGTSTPHAQWKYYWNNELQAVRCGPWKLHFPHSYYQPSPVGGHGRPGTMGTAQLGLTLFNLDEDVGETLDVAAQHPDVVARLQAVADAARQDLGDSLSNQTGLNVRPPGRTTE